MTSVSRGPLLSGFQDMHAAAEGPGIVTGPSARGSGSGTRSGHRMEQPVPSSSCRGMEGIAVSSIGEPQRNEATCRSPRRRGPLSPRRRRPWRGPGDQEAGNETRLHRSSWQAPAIIRKYLWEWITAKNQFIGFYQKEYAPDRGYPDNYNPNGHSRFEDDALIPQRGAGRSIRRPPSTPTSATCAPV